MKPDWATDAMQRLDNRARQIDFIYGKLGETFLTRTSQEWLDLLGALGIPCAPLRTPGELFDNEHLADVAFFETVENPQGPVRFPGVPTWFSKTPGKVAGPTPLMGQDTDAVLAELGMGESNPA